MSAGPRIAHVEGGSGGALLGVTPMAWEKDYTEGTEKKVIHF